MQQRAEDVSTLEQGGDVDEDVDADQILGLDVDGEREEHELEVAHADCDGDQNAEDSGPRSEAGNIGREAEDVGERERRREDCATDGGGEVEFAEEAAAVCAFEDG